MWGRPQNKKVNRRKGAESRLKLSGPALARLALGLAVVAVLAIAGSLTVGALDQNIAQVSVTGRFQRVSPVEVEQAVKARVRDIGLVSVDLSAVQRAVEQLPWVDTASVERH